MEAMLIILSAGLFSLGLVRFLNFKFRLHKYTKTKATITDYEIETKYFSSSGIETDKAQYDRFSPVSNWKKVGYYSPQLTYQAHDNMEYEGTWWIEMPNGIPHNIGELVEIYYNPDKPGKFFMYDKTMMFIEPMLLMGIGLAGIISMLFVIF